jgi:hypothetical protein
MLKQQTLEFKSAPASLNWKEDRLVDWVGGGSEYHLDGSFVPAKASYPNNFNAAIQSPDGNYVALYERLGTKGLLLKNGQVLKELKRASYSADSYEYPIAFLQLPDNTWSIVHCPHEYNILEIDAVEGNAKIVSKENRTPVDCFYSRLRVNPSNTLMLHAGWVWHPYNVVELFDVGSVLANPHLLDNNENRYDIPIKAEVASAEFLDDDLIVVSTTEDHINEVDLTDKHHLYAHQIGLYSVNQEQFVKKINIGKKVGTIVPLTQDLVMELYQYPKVFDLNTGQIIQEFKEIDSGTQYGPFILRREKVPSMAIDVKNKRVAIANGTKIDVLSLEKV